MIFVSRGDDSARPVRRRPARCCARRGERGGRSHHVDAVADRRPFEELRHLKSTPSLLVPRGLTVDGLPRSLWYTPSTPRLARSH